MDLQCDQVQLPPSSRLKIRRAPSSKLSAPSSPSFHGNSLPKKKPGRCSNLVIQPLIFHAVDPEIIKTEPAEFMCMVQRLTGSPNTRRLVRSWMRRSKQLVQSSLQAVQDVHLVQQGNNDALMKEGTRAIMAPATSLVNANLSINDLPALYFPSSSPNPPELTRKINHPPELPLISTNNPINLKTNPPSSSDSSNFAISNANHPLSPMSSSTCAIISSKGPSQLLPSVSPKHSPLPAKSSNNKHSDLALSPSASKYRGTKNLPPSAQAAYSSEELSRGPPCSPVSPHSCLTTTSEGYHTDNLSTEGGPWDALCFEPCNSEEDGSINFFDFSLDSYYGNFSAAQDDEVHFYHSHVLDPFYQ